MITGGESVGILVIWCVLRAMMLVNIIIGKVMEELINEIDNSNIGVRDYWARERCEEHLTYRSLVCIENNFILVPVELF